MADRVDLCRFALAVVERAAEPIAGLAAEPVARAPEVSGARLIGDVAQHPSHFAFLDLPEGLATELEVVALLIDREAAVAHDQDAAIDARDELIERRVAAGRLERDVRHARERHA